MRHTQRAVALLLLLSWAIAVYAQETDVQQLIAKPDPVLQAQIQKIFDALQKPGVDPLGNVDAFREVQSLKTINKDKDELVKQLAIWAVTTKSEEDSHVLIAQEVLHLLNLPSSVLIRVLAPYLNADNRQLRGFAAIWFDSHDMARTAPAGAPPIKPVNYEDYLEYVEWKVTHKGDVPAGFVKYIYERSPGRALVVFAYANSHGDVTTRLQAIRKSIEARQQGIEPQAETGQRLEGGRQARLRERSDIELAEHIISNSIWLNKNGFAERFQQTLPDANAQLTKLAHRQEWWTRLYVAYIMRQHRELRPADILQLLSVDSNALVNEVANSVESTNGKHD